MLGSPISASRRGTRGVINSRQSAPGYAHFRKSSTDIARRTTTSLHGLTVALALLASLIFVLTDADGGRSATSLGLQIFVEFAATMGFAWLVRRRMAVMNETPLIMPLLWLIIGPSIPLLLLASGTGDQEAIASLMSRAVMRVLLWDSVRVDC